MKDFWILRFDLFQQSWDRFPRNTRDSLSELNPHRKSRGSFSLKKKRFCYSWNSANFCWEGFTTDWCLQGDQRRRTSVWFMTHLTVTSCFYEFLFPIMEEDQEDASHVFYMNEYLIYLFIYSTINISIRRVHLSEILWILRFMDGIFYSSYLLWSEKTNAKNWFDSRTIS